MKKVYIVKVAKVTADWGTFKGYQVIGCVDNEKKIEKKIAEFRAENQVNEYWMRYETDKENNIKAYVDEYEVE